MYVTPENWKTSDELVIMLIAFTIQIPEVDLCQRTSWVSPLQANLGCNRNWLDTFKDLLP